MRKQKVYIFQIATFLKTGVYIYIYIYMYIYIYIYVYIYIYISRKQDLLKKPTKLLSFQGAVFFQLCT